MGVNYVVSPPFSISSLTHLALYFFFLIQSILCWLLTMFWYDRLYIHKLKFLGQFHLESGNFLKIFVAKIHHSLIPWPPLSLVSGILCMLPAHPPESMTDIINGSWHIFPWAGRSLRVTLSASCHLFAPFTWTSECVSMILGVICASPIYSLDWIYKVTF